MMLDIITIDYDSPNTVTFFWAIEQGEGLSVTVPEHARRVTLLVELDYLTRYPHTSVSSSGGRLLTLIEHRVVLVDDELKLQLTYAYEPAPTHKRTK